MNLPVMLTAENGSSLTRRPSPGFSAKRRWCESLSRRPRGRAARPFEVRFVPIPSRLPDRQHALIDAGRLGLARRSTLLLPLQSPRTADRGVLLRKGPRARASVAMLGPFPEGAHRIQRKTGSRRRASDAVGVFSARSTVRAHCAAQPPPLSTRRAACARNVIRPKRSSGRTSGRQRPQRECVDAE